MVNDTLDGFTELLIQELRNLEERRRTNTPGPSRIEVIEPIEADLRESGLEPWQLYEKILRTAVTPEIRRTAVNLLHDPTRVPEYAAQGIANTVAAVMREEGLDSNLGQQIVMAASILRSYDPPTAMLPIPRESIDLYFIPSIWQTPTPRQGQSQEYATLNHTAHMLASTARFTVLHGGAHNDLLKRELDDFYGAQAIFKDEVESKKDELERQGKLENQRFYAIVHPMEHLAELMDQATMTRDRGLVELLMRNSIVDMFNLLDKQRLALGIQGDVEKYFRQRDGFLAVAKGVGYKVN